MTQQQIDRIRKRISDIKRTLAAEKRKYGGYDDGRGLRYLPTKYFIQLGDYSGGLAYTKWFDKAFPDDGGYPDFLFEWTVILFKSGKTKEAAKKAFQTFCSNTYLFDKYFGKQIMPVDKWEGSNWQIPSFAENFAYSSAQPALADFSEWLNSLISAKDFLNRSSKFIDIYKKLKTEHDPEARHFLVHQACQLEQSK